jgi:prepilin-type N-terminal cleavage/methylation domain-containing protein
LNPRKHKSKAGFTLIEIMIVVGIIGIFMTMGVPSLMRSLEKDELSRAIRDTIEGCKTARDRAILQATPWEFIIKIEGDLAQLNVQAAPGEARAGAARGGPSGDSLKGSPYSLFPRKLGDDVMIQLIDVNFVNHMELPEARVRFYPNGTSDEFTVVYALKSGKETRQRTVTLDIVTGQATEFIKR